MTPKQEAFVNEYLSNGGNGAAAYRTAYGVEGPTAEVNASKLLRDAKVKAAIDEVRQRDRAKSIMDFDELMEHVAGMIRNPKALAYRVSAAKLYANLMGWEPAQRMELEQTGPVKHIAVPAGVKIVTDPNYDAELPDGN